MSSLKVKIIQTTKLNVRRIMFLIVVDATSNEEFSSSFC